MVKTSLRLSNGLIFTFFLLFLALPGCDKKQSVDPHPVTLQPTATATETAMPAMANPAAIFCQEQGGAMEIRQGQAGEYGVCSFEDGSECEEWDYYKGYCQPGQTGLADDPAIISKRETPTSALEDQIPDQSTVPEAALTRTVLSVTPSLNPFIPDGLDILSEENTGDLQAVANLSAPSTYWTGFSSDSAYLTTAIQSSQDRRWHVDVWDLYSGERMYSLPGGPEVYFSTGSGQLVAQVLGQGYAIYDLENGSLSKSLTYPEAVALSPDMELIASISSPDSGVELTEITLFDTTPKTELQTMTLPGVVVVARFSPDGRRLAITTGGLTSETTIFDVQTGAALTTLAGVDRLTFSPDGHLIAGLFGPNKELRLLDGQDFSQNLTLDNNAGPQAQEIAFSAGGEMLAAALGNGVRLWDTNTGQELATIPVQASAVSFSPDGRLLVTSNFQGEIRLWAVKP